VKSDILVILPTRERPAAALQALASILETSQGRVDVVLCQDEDDPKALRIDGKNVMTRIGPHKPFARWINAAAIEFCQDYPIMGWSADDVRYCTPLWDFRVRLALKNVPGIVYGPDGIQDENLPTHPFFSSALVQALGRLTSLKFCHYYGDTYLKELGIRLGFLRYMKSLVIEHRHHSIGQSAFDKISAVNEKVYEQDALTFHEAMSGIEADVATVRAFLTAKTAVSG
jgi:hypothetical protein